MKLILAIRYQNDRFGDQEKMHSVITQNEMAEKFIRSFVAQSGGEVVTQFDGDLIASIPVENSEMVHELVQRLKSDYNLFGQIGIGEDVDQATAALKDIKSVSKPIKVFDALNEKHMQEMPEKSPVLIEPKTTGVEKPEEQSEPPRKMVVHHNDVSIPSYSETHDEFGYPLKTAIYKTEELHPDLFKSKKDMMPMFGPAPAPHHHEFADWASKALPNKDWQIWAARNYKTKPESFTPEVKQELEHFGGSTHIPEVAKVRFNKTHTLEDGLKAFKDGEAEYNKRIGDNLNVVKPDVSTKKIMDVGNNMAWYSLGRGSCSAEGKAMGHCGNVPSEKAGDRILSLRTEHKNSKGEIFHEPHATFIANNGYLGEMKGRANTKPGKKYHKAIADLLVHPKIKGIVGGGYLHHQNFDINDLDPVEKERVQNLKPNITVYDRDEAPSDLPEKFKSEVKPVLDFKEKIKDKHGTDWRQGIIDAVRNGNAPTMALNVIKNPTDEELHSVITSPKSARDARVQAAMIGKDTGLLHGALATHQPDDIEYLNNPNLNAIIGSKSEKAIENLAGNRSLTSKNIDKLMSHTDFETFPAKAHANLARHDNLDPKHHEKLVNSPHAMARRAISQRDDFDNKHLDKLINDEDQDILENLARKKDLKPEHIEKLASHPSDSVAGELAEYGHNLPLEVQQKLVSRGIMNRLADNENSLHPEIAKQLANYAANNEPDRIDHISDLRRKLLSNKNTPTEALETLLNSKEGKEDYLDIPHQVYQHPNLTKPLYDKMVAEHATDPDKAGKYLGSILNSEHLTPEQFKSLKSKYGRKWNSDFKQHKMYEAKPSEITPDTHWKLLQNHFDKLKTKDPKKYEAAQGKIINQALQTGQMKPVQNIIESGILDDNHHKMLHDQLNAIDRGDHDYSSNQSWDGDDYNDMMHEVLSNESHLPKSYHEELLNRLQDNGQDVEDIANRLYEDNKENYHDEAFERANEIARDNYTFKDYLDKFDYGRGEHALDRHIDNGGRRNDLSGLNDMVHELTMDNLRNDGKIDEDGNYSDDDYDDYQTEAKDLVYDDLKEYLHSGQGGEKFPDNIRTDIDRYRDDNLYEGYDESVRDGGGWDQAYNDAHDEIQEKHKTGPEYWPKHLRELDWVKNNIKPEEAHPGYDEPGEGPDDWGVPEEQNQKSENIQKSEPNFVLNNSHKNQIAKILSVVNNNQDFFKQLAKTNPEAVQNISNLIKSLQLMVAEEQKRKDDYLNKNIKLIQGSIEKNYNKELEEQQKELDNNINDNYEPQYKEHQDAYFDRPYSRDNYLVHDDDFVKKTDSHDTGLSKAGIPKTSESQIATLLHSFQKKKSEMKELFNQNPEAMEAIGDLAAYAAHFFDNQSKKPLKHHFQIKDMEDALDEQFGNSEELGKDNA